jgi:serine/threonine protein kinase
MGLLKEGLTEHDQQLLTSGPSASEETSAGPELDKFYSVETRFLSALSGSGLEPSAAMLSPGRGHAATEQSLADPRRSNLDSFHHWAQIKRNLSTGCYSKFKSVADCCRNQGKVEIHRQSGRGQGDFVVVKRVLTTWARLNVGKETNERMLHRNRNGERDLEDTLSEIGVYSYLSRQRDLPEYILKMYRAFEAGPEVWLVQEYADGGDMHTHIQALNRRHGSVPAQQLMQWMWEMLQGISYLHAHRIAHRDVSIENVLLCHGVVRVMDFGQAVATHSLSGDLIRYFCAAGKPYCRAPEQYVPFSEEVQVMVPQAAHPGDVTFARTLTENYLCEVLLPVTAVPGQKCAAEPWGYAAPNVDIFAAGVCLFIMASGMPPWRKTMLCDEHFAWVYTNGLAKLIQGWQIQLSRQAQDLLQSMLLWNPQQRPTAKTCLEHEWFGPLRGREVPVHAPEVPDAAAEAEAEERSGLPGLLGSYGGLGGATEHDWPVASRTVGMGGDFYCMQDAFRGVPSAPSALPTPPRPAPLARATATSGVSAAQRFSESQRPPALPSERAELLEPTTLFVAGCSVAAVGNHLLDLLEKETGVSVTKVNAQKFTLRAALDVEAGACALKVRLSAGKGDGGSAVEFQRRGGDSTALHWVFGRVADHLKQCLGVDAISGAAGLPVSASRTRPLSAEALPSGKKNGNGMDHLDQAAMFSPPKPSVGQTRPRPQPRALRASWPATTTSARRADSLGATRAEEPSVGMMAVTFPLPLHDWQGPGVKCLLQKSRQRRALSVAAAAGTGAMKGVGRAIVGQRPVAVA